MRNMKVRKPSRKTKRTIRGEKEISKEEKTKQRKRGEKKNIIKNSGWLQVMVQVGR